VTHVPIRTCAGCGRKAPKQELVRFVVRDGVLTHGPAEPGRGAYTCARLACYDRAVARRAFPRLLRQPVKLGNPPATLYTDDDGEREAE
jgi:N utilization substance protein A